MANKVLGLVVATALAALSGCGDGEPATSVTAPVSAPVTFASVPSAKVSKLLVFVVENRSLDQMRAAMPYTAALGAQFAVATSYRAVTHPSLANYLAMTGGSAFGVTDDGPLPDAGMVIPDRATTPTTANSRSLTVGSGRRSRS